MAPMAGGTWAVPDGRGIGPDPRTRIRQTTRGQAHLFLANFASPHKFRGTPQAENAVRTEKVKKPNGNYLRTKRACAGPLFPKSAANAKIIHGVTFFCLRETAPLFFSLFDLIFLA